MGVDTFRASCLKFLSLPYLFFLILIFSSIPVLGQSPRATSPAFSPSDSYLIDCGSSEETKLSDGRTFESDSASKKILDTEDDIIASVDNVNSINSSALPLYRTARIFTSESTYTFFISRPGRHWVRLYFTPLPHQDHNLTESVFSVLTDEIVLLHHFSFNDAKGMQTFKEYLIYSSEKFSIRFRPRKDSTAFVNAIEVVSAPDQLLPDTVFGVPQGSPEFKGLNNFAIQVSHRINVGGELLTPKNDTLSRTWLPDVAYNTFSKGSKLTNVKFSSVNYPEGGPTPLIAPHPVYASAVEMAESNTVDPNFNLSWAMTVDPGFNYFIRMHFCDIVSKKLNELLFDIYINELSAVSSFDLSSKTNELATAYYVDFVLNATAITDGKVIIQVGPGSNSISGDPNAILNGLEVMKMSNIAGSLDGLFGVDGKYYGGNGMSAKRILIVGFGFAMAGTAVIGLIILMIRWHKRPKDWQRGNSFSSWLLPIHASHSSFLSGKSSPKSTTFGSKKSKNTGFSSFFSCQGLGRFFTFSELQAATQNFDEKTVIGIGGFGKVYIADLEDGTKVAIKRGNSSSEQGMNEFQTEIQMLSKLRHRHLVSLIGFCDENQEMILVYEYMANGPLRDHIYGSNLPNLPWKKRLEICIGAARGLHYLHTGTAHGIIHRDVKTTNILLDENLVAKVSDFGLSKAGAMEQGHVSTAVKGSFGYLDPEYFRRQQLTEKSDVYSFGVVLFEVLCARPVINPQLPREQVNLAEYAMQLHRKGELEKIIDPRIAGTISKGSLKKFVEAAEKCLAEYGVDRPGMGDVLWNLEYALQLQEASAQAGVPDDNSLDFINLEMGSSSEGAKPSSGGGGNDDSEVNIFSPAADVQGR